MSVLTTEQSAPSIVTVGVRELKDHLSTYLRQVKAGKIIEITEHGKPVGRIIPQEMTVEEKLEAMRKAGLIRWSGKKLRPLEPLGEVIGDRTLSDIVIEERG